MPPGDFSGMCQNKLTRIVISVLQRTVYNIHAGEIDSLPRFQDSIAKEQLSPEEELKNHSSRPFILAQ